MERNNTHPDIKMNNLSVWQKYLEWVSLHPNVALEMETAFKWISYLVTGKDQFLYGNIMVFFCNLKF